MKKSILFLILTAIVFGTFGTYAQKPVYIYRNEGFIQTFITEEIDSITYSRIDADSMLHSDYCMTEIHACDTVFRIPIASIDSISFVTPTTILQPEVFNIDEKLLTWVTGREKLTFYLNPSTPVNLLPEKGKVVVSLANASTPIKGIFMGEVADIKTENDRIAIVCEPTSFEEAFVRLYSTANGVKTKSESTKSRAGEFDQGWEIWGPEKTEVNLLAPLNSLPIPISSIAYEPNDKLAFSLEDDPELSFAITPQLKYHISLTHDQFYGTSISLSIIGDYLFQEKFKLAGNIELSEDIPFCHPFIPFASGLADVFLEFGAYGKISTGIAIDKKWDQHYKSVFHWDWSKKAPSALKPVNNFKCIENKQEGNSAISGSLSAGLYLTIGVEFIASKNLDIAEIGLRLEGGAGIEGSFIPSKSDTIGASTSPFFYNKLRQRKLESFFEIGAQAKAKAFKWSISTPPEMEIGGIPLKHRFITNKISTVPVFTDFSMTEYDDNSISVVTNAKGYVGSNDLGFALSQDDIFSVNDYVYTRQDYRGPQALLSHTFRNKSIECENRVYPLIKWMGIQMIAGLDACVDEFHPHTVDLGLPSGTKWSCMNLGASFPTDFGEYYKMGNKDIATEQMGPGYSTPTKQQFEELLEYTTQKRVLKNGVTGFLFEAKNGNSIFLPAAAQLCWDSEEGGWTVNNEGSGGYWTTTQSEEDYNFFLEFDNEEDIPFFGNRDIEANKLTIRPVYSEK